MKTKHFLLGSSIIALAIADNSWLGFSAQLPDSTVSLSILVDKDIGDDLRLKANLGQSADETIDTFTRIDSKLMVGIAFVETPDLVALLDSGQTDIGLSIASADTTVFITKRTSLLDDETLGDGNLLVIAKGPQAQAVIQAFADLGTSKNLQMATVKTFFAEMTGHIDVGHSVTAKKTGTSTEKRVPVPA